MLISNMAGYFAKTDFWIDYLNAPPDKQEQEKMNKMAKKERKEEDRESENPTKWRPIETIIEEKYGPTIIYGETGQDPFSFYINIPHDDGDINKQPESKGFDFQYINLWFKFFVYKDNYHERKLLKINENAIKFGELFEELKNEINKGDSNGYGLIPNILPIKNKTFFTNKTEKKLKKELDDYDADEENPCIGEFESIDFLKIWRRIFFVIFITNKTYDNSFTGFFTEMKEAIFDKDRRERIRKVFDLTKNILKELKNLATGNNKKEEVWDGNFD
tara:strand:- start:6661 stop:7485 length:825 start_codon:yes stop_codon:yes gene_type:complete